VLRELIALKAECTLPDLGIIVNTGEGVEDRTTHAAAKGRIWDYCHLINWLQRSIDGRNRDHTAQSILPCARNNIPWHPYPIHFLKLKELRHFQ
jgi:hypothetical protein